MKKTKDRLSTKESFEKFAGKQQIDRDLLSEVNGGNKPPGKGYFATISGDCNVSGNSCWYMPPRL